MKLRDVVLFTVANYFIWFTCILSAASGRIWLGLILALIVTLTQLIWSHRAKIEIHYPLACLVLLSGITIDSILSLSSIIVYHANPWQLAPPWIIGIWLNFSLIYASCLLPLLTKKGLIATLAFIGFPLAYLAGAKLQAATLNYGYLSLLVVAITWAIVLPLLNHYLAQTKVDK